MVYLNGVAKLHIYQNDYTQFHILNLTPYRVPLPPSPLVEGEVHPPWPFSLWRLYEKANLHQT